MPDLLHHWLTGARGVEFTNATTTQMLDWRTGTWAVDLLQALDLPTHMLPPIVAPGTRLGPPLPACVARAPRLDGVPVIAPACHDTGSAVASVPSGGGVAFLSSGTWSLLGTETARPSSRRRRSRTTSPTKAASPAPRACCATSPACGCSRAACADGVPRGRRSRVEDVLGGAAQRPVCQSVIDPDDAGFHRAPDAAAVQAWCARTDQPVPASATDVARVVIDSLALAYRPWRAARWSEVTGTRVHTIRVIGGGARNRMLNQATADATSCRVLAGPVEATALGNVAMQLVTLGAVRTLADARALVAAAFPPEEFTPRSPQPWDEAADVQACAGTARCSLAAHGSVDGASSTPTLYAVGTRPVTAFSVTGRRRSASALARQADVFAERVRDVAGARRATR